MKRPRYFWPISLFLALPLLPLLLANNVQSQANPADMAAIGPGRRYTEQIPAIDIGDYGYRPVQLPAAQPVPSEVEGAYPDQQPGFRPGGGSDPLNPYAVIRQVGPAFAAPGAVAWFEISLANYESVTHTFQLENTLPAGLLYVPGSADGLIYDPATRTLSWRGELAPGNLDYLIEESPAAIPYLDLADFGAVNLCDDFVAAGQDCDEVTVTFNLGVNGYTTNLYGQVLSRLTLSANGLLLADGAAIPNPHGHNLWLPDKTPPGFLLAGLWRDANLGGVTIPAGGRWHAAIVTGLIEDHDVFYAQWHDAPHALDPNLTARHAIVVVLNGDPSAGSGQAPSAGSGQAPSTGSGQALAGHAFFIYDNISDPAQTVARGYTIGIEDRPGLRGATHAYAPCCGDPRPPQGYPPAAGTTLHLRPVLFGGDGDYRRTFRFAAVVNGQVPEIIINTAAATSSSPDPALANVWASHYLYVRWQSYLPLLRLDEVAP
jgi:hypothetical protein